MTDAYTPDLAAPPLPWFLQEPPVYPTAAPLVATMQDMLGRIDRSEQRSGVLTHGPLTLEWWDIPWADFAMPSHIRPGACVRWQGRVVLLCTHDLECWCYCPGAKWQTALYALAKEHRPTRGFAVTDDELLAMETAQLPQLVWTGNASVPGRLGKQNEDAVRLTPPPRADYT